MDGPLPPPTAEELRLADARSGAANWRRWGPYLSERQWGTVREDYRADGTAWDFFPHDHARSRAYRWGEDGIAGISDDGQTLCFAIALWNGQDAILKGDPAGPPPPAQRASGRNARWCDLTAGDVFSMPDKWVYPRFAARDLGFHVIALALIDPDFTKRQLLLITNERYLSHTGAIPAYEWAFGDVNPPVHAWSAMRVYEIERKMYGRADRPCLETMFHNLLMPRTTSAPRSCAEFCEKCSIPPRF